MRICAVQVMIAVALCGVSLAHPGYSQLLEKEITLDVSGVSFEEALHELAVQSKIKFAYSLDHLAIKGKVSIHATRTPLREVLDELLTPLNVQYKVHDHGTIISLKRKNTNARPPDHAQGTRVNLPRQVTGIVRDAAQQPMAGVNVLVKSTTNGTTTNAEGRFEISAGPDDVLIFSFIGYTSVEWQVTDIPHLEIVLYEDVNTLGEIVVNAGYWEVKERENTGSIAKLSAEEIAQQPVNNLLQAMQGRLTGVYITQQSGVPGSNFTVQVRGRNSIAAGNDPLYIIDGVPYPSASMSTTFTTGSLYGSGGSSPLSSLSPENIASIEVLKDADATAIYGSRGANGVILITTKKATDGTSRFTLNVNTGVSDAVQRVKLMNTQQFLTMRHEGFRNDNLAPTISNAPDLLVWDTTRYTDWQEKLIGGRAAFTNVSAGLAGGNKDIRYIFNNSYQNQGTVFPGDARYHRGTSHLSVIIPSFANKVTTNFDISFNVEKNAIQPIDLTSQALNFAPNAPALYDEHGKLNWEQSTWTNPMAYMEQTYEAVTRNMIAGVDIGYKILKGVELKSRFSFNDLRLNEKQLIPSSFFNPAFGFTAQNAISRFNTNSHVSWIWEPQLTYQQNFGRLEMNLLAGGTFQNTDREQLVQSGTNFASDALIEDINAAGTVDVLINTKTRYRYSAFFGRANATFDGKYILNLTARRDGSSRFGPANRFANFMAVGAAWIFSNEGFIKNNLSFLSFGKLRASYGTTGNDQIGDYAYLNTYQPSNPYLSGASLVPTRLYNPDYAWEINRKFEVAFDFRLFRDRVNLKTNFYSNRSSSQLVGYPLPSTTGFSSVQANLGATVQNTGWEFELGTTNISKESMTWTSQFTLTIPRNKLVSFPGLETSTYSTQYVVGEPLTISKRYKFLGVDAETGVYRFEDLNGDGSLTSADRLHLKNIAVKAYGGLNNSVSYRNFRLELFLQFVKQNGLNYEGLLFSYPGTRAQQPVSVLHGRWMITGDQASIQKFAASNAQVSTAQAQYRDSDAVIKDASFVRIKNVSLSYTMPKSTLKTLECMFYVQAQNLYTFTDYDGLDPESRSLSLPALRTITAGLTLTF